ncbi:Uncharacterised protein [Mycobacteroides abscessus subsp. abscessus]|nr:Uncharacterised protein [Mycobacteroides abscessus subsp. abscessus]
MVASKWSPSLRESGKSALSPEQAARAILSSSPGVNAPGTPCEAIFTSAPRELRPV